jgi:hypothetical protein
MKIGYQDFERIALLFPSHSVAMRFDRVAFSEGSTIPYDDFSEFCDMDCSSDTISRVVPNILPKMEVILDRIDAYAYGHCCCGSLSFALISL